MRFIDSERLIDLGYNGAAFTWNNKRKVRENNQERLDRGFISDDWRVLFPPAYITYLTALNSDHRPLLLNTTLDNIPKACLFRFETMWARDPTTVCVIGKILNCATFSNPLHQLKAKLKSTEAAIKT